MENAVNINIKCMNGTAFALKISMDQTVLSLKNMIHELRALEVERQRIIYGLKRLAIVRE